MSVATLIPCVFFLETDAWHVLVPCLLVLYVRVPYCLDQRWQGFSGVLNSLRTAYIVSVSNWGSTSCRPNVHLMHAAKHTPHTLAGMTHLPLQQSLMLKQTLEWKCCQGLAACLRKEGRKWLGLPVEGPTPSPLSHVLCCCWFKSARPSSPDVIKIICNAIHLEGWQMLNKLETKAPTKHSPAPRHYCSFVVAVSISSHFFSSTIF